MKIKLVTTMSHLNAMVEEYGEVRLVDVIQKEAQKLPSVDKNLTKLLAEMVRE